MRTPARRRTHRTVRVAPASGALEVVGHSPVSHLTPMGRRGRRRWGQRFSRGAVVSSERPPIPPTPTSLASRLEGSRRSVSDTPMRITPLRASPGSAAGSLRRRSLRGFFSRRRSGRVAPMTPGQEQQEPPERATPPPVLEPAPREVDVLTTVSPKKPSAYLARQQTRIRRAQEARRVDEARSTLKRTAKKREEISRAAISSSYAPPFTPVRGASPHTIDHQFIVDRFFGGTHIIFPDESAGSRRDERREELPDFRDIEVRNLIRHQLALALAMRVRRFPGPWIGTISNAFKRQDATLIFIKHYALVRSDGYDEFKTTEFYQRNQVWLDAHLNPATDSETYRHRASLFRTYDSHPYQLLMIFQLHNMGGEEFFMKAIVPPSIGCIRKIEVLGRIIKEKGFLFRSDKWHIETDETLAEEGLNPYRFSPATLARLRG